jgi:hypothetical protein
MENQKEPFPQFINPHRRRHFHWAMFLIVALALAAALLIVIENFKTAEEIDSMAPVFRSKIESSKQFENVVVYEGRKVEFGKLVVILKEDSKNSDLVIKTISEKAQGIVVWELKATQTYIIKFKVDSMQDLEKLKKEVSEIKEVEYVGFSSAYVTEPF